MSVNYEGRMFRAVANSAGGDVDAQTTFHYRQSGTVVWATYSGGAVVFGTLLAVADPEGALEMLYQHLAGDGTLRAGRCRSRPEILADGRLRLHERWTWTAGAEGHGASTVEEYRDVGARGPGS